MRRAPLMAVLTMLAGMAGAVPSAFGVAMGMNVAEQQVTGSAAFSDDGARDRIVESIQRKHNARVVKVTEIVVDGRRVYSLRLLSDGGRVWMVRVDAESGRELTGNE